MAKDRRSSGDHQRSRGGDSRGRGGSARGIGGKGNSGGKVGGKRATGDGGNVAGGNRSGVAGGGGSAGGAAATGSQLELAKVHGVSQQAVSKWIRDPRWREAGFSVGGPWGAKEIARQRAWRLDVLREDPHARAGAGGGAGDADDPLDEAKGEKIGRALRVAQLKKLIAQEEQIQLDNAIKRKEFVRRSEAEEAGAAKFRAVRVGLMALPRALRQALADAGDPGMCEEILAAALRAICVNAFGKGGE